MVRLLLLFLLERVLVQSGVPQVLKFLYFQETLALQPNISYPIIYWPYNPVFLYFQLYFGITTHYLVSFDHFRGQATQRNTQPNNNLQFKAPLHLLPLSPFQTVIALKTSLVL